MQATINRAYYCGSNCTQEDNSQRVVRSVVMPALITAFSICYRKDLADKKADAVYEKLSRIELLTDNWNGYGALAINREVLANTRRLLGFLKVKPEVFPVADGSIQIEYDRSDGAYLEFHIESGDSFSFYQVSEDGIESSGEKLMLAEVVRKINGFVK